MRCYVVMRQVSGTVLAVYADWRRLVSGLGALATEGVQAPAVGEHRVVSLLGTTCRIECHPLLGLGLDSEAGS